MCDTRALGILATSFVGGIICAVALTARSFSEPIPEPFFGLQDAPAVDVSAAEPDQPRQPSAADPAAAPRPPVGGFADMAAALARPPERLALAGGPGPAVGAVQAQALPDTAVGGNRVQHAAPAVPVERLDPTAVAEPQLQAVGTDGQAEPSATELKALVDRVRTAPVPRPVQRVPDPPDATESPPPSPAPLPGAEWNDPDQVNWSDAAADQGHVPGSAAVLPGGRRRGIFGDRKAEVESPPAEPAPLRAGRLLDRLRGDRRQATAAPDEAVTEPLASGGWPVPVRLLEQIDQVAQGVRPAQPGEEDVAAWATLCRDRLQEVLATAGPADERADAALLALGEAVPLGMAAGDALPDAVVASLIRRAALAVSRRVAAWRAAAAVCGESAVLADEAPGSDVGRRLTAARLAADTAGLLAALERFESGSSLAEAAAVTAALRDIAATGSAPAADLSRAVGDHYLAPNVRIAVHQRLVERMMPEATVKTGPMQDFVLGRKVRGTSTVEQSTGFRFVPDGERIRCELVVRGEVDSRTVTDAGPAAIHSRGAATFTVRKPMTISPAGLAFGTALGSASNQSQLGTIQTSFDGVPLMGSIMERIVRNQADESKPQAAREVNEKIIARACREVDLQSEPKFAEMAERIRERIWSPMVQLGLQPTAVALESTADLATLRLRLAAANQLAAHTPRPRAPPTALLGVQVHESTLNNGCERLELAGNAYRLEDLIRTVCQRIGIEPRIPDDLPEGVTVAFAATQPLRLDFRDGLVHVRVALAAIESGRRSWYDVVAEVAYRPTSSGPQVLLERSGQVHLPDRKGLELPLRTIFAKIFPKERPIALFPAAVAKNPRLADLRAVQLVSTDGWFAIALDGPSEAPAPAPAIGAPKGRARLPAARGLGPRRR